jgi:hypothetical protein
MKDPKYTPRAADSETPFKYRTQRRKAAFRAFNQGLIEDPMIAYLYETAAAARVSSAVMSLFNAVYDRYGPQPVGETGQLDSAITTAAEELRKTLRYERICREDNDARDVMAEIMQRAKDAVSKPKVSARLVRRETEEAARVRLLRMRDSLDTLPDGEMALMQDIRAFAMATGRFAREVAPLMKYLADDTYIPAARNAIYDAVKHTNIRVEQAISLAADVVRTYYDQQMHASPSITPTKGAKDYPALFATQYPGFFGALPDTLVSDEARQSMQEETLREMKECGAISPAITVMLLDTQREAARDAAIAIARALMRHELRRDDPQFRERVDTMVDAHLKPLDTLANSLKQQGMLFDCDREALKRNAVRIKVFTQQFVTHDEGRHIGR